MTRTSSPRSAPSSRSTSATTRWPWSRRSPTRKTTVGPGHPMRALPEHRASGGIAVTPPAPAPAPIPAQPPRRRATFLPLAPPLLGHEEIDEAVDTLRPDWITTGPKTRRFETGFAASPAAPGARGLNPGTAALHTALVTLGIGPGDEVLPTPMTFAASV